MLCRFCWNRFANQRKVCSTTNNNNSRGIDTASTTSASTLRAWGMLARYSTVLTPRRLTPFTAKTSSRTLEARRREQPPAANSTEDIGSLLPLPDWPTALETWGAWWGVHVYGFSALFLLLSLVSCAVFFRFRRRVQKFKIVFPTRSFPFPGHLRSAEDRLPAGGSVRVQRSGGDPDDGHPDPGCLPAVLRVLRFDPVIVTDRGKNVVIRLILILSRALQKGGGCCGRWAWGREGYILKYRLPQVMLLRITKVDVGNSKVRSLSWLMGCTLTYMFLVVVIESLVSFERSLKLLLLIDSGCFIAWTLYLGITFICSGFRLSQYANEAKRARKELNAFSSNRRSASNNTSLIATSPTTNNLGDSAPYSVDLTSASMNPETAIDDVFPEQDAEHPYSLAPLSAPRNNLRLSRPKLKISDNNHMMVTIASDEDDVSTSSTDVENFKDESSRQRSLRKRYRHTQKQKRSSSAAKTKPTSSAYVALSTKGDAKCKPNTPIVKNCRSNCDPGSKTDSNDMQKNCVALSTVESVDSYTVVFKGTVSQFPMSDIMGNHSERVNQAEISAVQDQELPLLQTPDSSYVGTLNTINALSIRDVDDSLDDDLLEDDDDGDADATRYVKVNSKQTTDLDKSTSNVNTEPLTGTDFLANEIIDDMGQNSCCAVDPTGGNHTPHTAGQAESTFYSRSEHDHLSNSPRDNGYLADTENIFYCSSVSKQCGTAGRPATSRDESGQLSCDLSSQRSTPTHSDDESILSPAISDRMRSITPAALGLFRIRQSKMVQRAVHLTYFLTFLFMFACLLQLYTVFGVYGVLATIPRPDPWPWLIFHTIFR
ncbi:hypothetical protein Btru_039801 [Bulinus truncatus]|nr:hypothetical protein Btru_039801 [Bulinus truncatus]